MTEGPVACDGLVVVDKPSGWTSHDVVGRLRRLAGTRRVGHAGTLDPMATGVLVCGVGRATRLLGHLSASDKSYQGTIRLGQSTVTDDAEGEVTRVASAERVDEAVVREALAAMVGEIDQVPSKVSAVKVGGKRSYARVRAGEEVTLEPRRVTIGELAVEAVTRPSPEVMDVDISITCSTGTYVRAIARDLGEGLGVGGHLTRLRRVRVGPFDLATARTIDELAHSFSVMSLSDAVRTVFPARVVAEAETDDVRHGRPIPAEGESGLVGVFDDQGRVLALMEQRGELLRVVIGFAGAS